MRCSPCNTALLLICQMREHRAHFFERNLSELDTHAEVELVSSSSTKGKAKLRPAPDRLDDPQA
jgi:hypothetical protein